MKLVDDAKSMASCLSQLGEPFRPNWSSGVDDLFDLHKENPSLAFQLLMRLVDITPSCNGLQA